MIATGLGISDPQYIGPNPAGLVYNSKVKLGINGNATFAGASTFGFGGDVSFGSKSVAGYAGYSYPTNLIGFGLGFAAGKAVAFGVSTSIGVVPFSLVNVTPGLLINPFGKVRLGGTATVSMIGLQSFALGLAAKMANLFVLVFDASIPVPFGSFSFYPGAALEVTRFKLAAYYNFNLGTLGVTGGQWGVSAGYAFNSGLYLSGGTIGGTSWFARLTIPLSS
jgi:hypothetical protein